MSDVVVAVDIDLRRVHSWCSECGLVCSKAPNALPVMEHLYYKHRHATVLMEVAGAVDYTDNKAIAHNKRRWTIWNIAEVSRINHCFTDELWENVRLRVAPSSKWTHGHDVKVRHALAKCTAKTKDTREAEAMIWFYRKTPSDWVSLDEYLENL